LLDSHSDRINAWSVWSVIETHLHQTGSKKAATASRNEAAGFVGMQSGARVKVLKTLELMKGVAPLYSAWKFGKFPQCFQKPFRHFAALWAIEITREFRFVGMATSPLRVLFMTFNGGQYLDTVIILGAYGNPRNYFSPEGY
jgi:hypothetical protein